MISKIWQIWTLWFYFKFSLSPQGWHRTVSWSAADEPCRWMSLIQMSGDCGTLRWQFISPSVSSVFLPVSPSWNCTVCSLSLGLTPCLYNFAKLSLIQYYSVNMCGGEGTSCYMQGSQKIPHTIPPQMGYFTTAHIEQILSCVYITAMVIIRLVKWVRLRSEYDFDHTK